MSTQNANTTELTDDQAHQILSDLANIDHLKLNKREHFFVQMALDKFKNLVEQKKTQAELVKE